MKPLLIAVVTLALGIPPAMSAETFRQGMIEVVAPFARATLPKSPTGGAYLTIINQGQESDRLISVSTPVAAAVQMHQSKVENGIASMRQLTDGIEVPAGGTVVLEPSGTHLMLTRLAQPLVEGETLSLTLNFERAGAVTIILPVGGIAARKAP